MKGLPGSTALVRDYLGNEVHLSRFFSGGFRDPAAYLEKAAEVDERFHKGAREAALEMIRTSTPAAQGRLDRFVDEGGYFVTTGQQPGLFSGPLYSLYKALTCIRLAEGLEELMAKPVLALFWIASEDHDWEEADHTHVLDLQNELVTVRVPAQAGAENHPLHRISLREGTGETLDAFLSALPDTDFSPPFVELLRRAYAPGATLAEGFLEVVSDLLADYPVAFVDAGDRKLKEGSLPVLFRELENAEGHETTLARVAAHLEQEGYHVQVPLLEGGINLFLEGPEGRDRLYRDGDGVRLNRAGTRMSLDEVRSAAEADPTTLSPNVLLRPVVESSLFPTLAYVGGPGEMAYFAQLKEFFQAHGIRMPLIHPRHSVTLVESKIGKVLEKFHRSPASLDRPFHEVAAEVALDEVPPDVRRALGELRGAVGKGTGALSSAAKAIDPTLKGPVTHARNTALAAFDDLEKKILQALKRENEIALEQLEKAQRHLFPMGKPQERILNAFYYLTRYGPEFVSALHDDFAVDLDPHSD
jgi:bacillithiol biosynthesis cysteine-adding enzyme BshC